METQHAKVSYIASTHTTGGRIGESRSSDGQLDIRLSSPGSNREGTNPEQLFASGWSACFIGALGKAASNFNTKLPEGHYVDAEIDLVQGQDGYSLEARLNISLPGIEPDVARQMIDMAQDTCPYSKAVKGNVKTVYNLI
ncbi:Ohr family peroxiredoxin [Flavobacterium selenitireducens]|uniref:Ohr family peroxiredoxin n=1 Tax=Flavobacterium selenitireducens TaxID=2722704 RepID=UPI00168BAB6B|nr:Ohr family peroxiredoxin [Flavobacterium selenitireducens]MBD3581265.1 Ohr family peroxiredoxin [Flavobacterium selenitireducens]